MVDATIDAMIVRIEKLQGEKLGGCPELSRSLSNFSGSSVNY
jgi:hypothetical protein